MCLAVRLGGSGLPKLDRGCLMAGFVYFVVGVGRGKGSLVIGVGRGSLVIGFGSNCLADKSECFRDAAVERRA